MISGSDRIGEIEAAGDGERRTSKLPTLDEAARPDLPRSCDSIGAVGGRAERTPPTDEVWRNRDYRDLRSTGRLHQTWIQLVNYDGHATMKSRGEQQTVEGLWKLVKPPTIAIGFCKGDYFPSPLRLNEYKGSVVCSRDFDGDFCLRSLQNGIISFNCADSLDRTK
ncbi:uncharacterized protein A4U43_C04F13680 [Asparagus officinalis]|uniref:Uncharacterized protein n=1 Tax=Asparagus officinalis TaxID=4686 RepID=A0A5P1F5F2_ASPOF|nr:uncharacterized protein A4U43_C04F13680 [Asparagus officinalis]